MNRISKQHLFILFLFFIFTVLYFQTPCFASKGSEAVLKFTNDLYDYIRYAGFIILVYASGMLFMSMKSENPEGLSKYGMMIAVSCFLISIKTLFGFDTIKKQTGEQLTSTLADKILEVFRYGGFLICVWGIGSIVLSFKNEDPDSKSRGIMCMCSGIFMIALPSIISQLY